MTSPLFPIIMAVWIAAVMGILVCLFMLFRNDWVYRKRMEVLHNPDVGIGQQLADFSRLPDYDVMMHRWWIWDINKFMGPR